MSTLKEFFVACLLAAVPANAQVLVHQYDFSGDLNDSLGGAALTSAGGNLTDPGYYSFAPNQGLSLLAAASLAGSYTIGIRMSFDAVDGYRKILDFKGLSSDAGLYCYNGKLDFYPISSTGTFLANTFVDVVITRDGASGIVNAFLQGQPALTFSDTGASASAVTSLPSGKARFEFLRDDTVTGAAEASGGKVDRIVVYDGPLAPGDIPSIAAVPEPAACAVLTGLSLAGLCAYRRTRTK